MSIFKNTNLTFLRGLSHAQNMLEKWPDAYINKTEEEIRFTVENKIKPFCTTKAPEWFEGYTEGLVHLVKIRSL